LISLGGEHGTTICSEVVSEFSVEPGLYDFLHVLNNTNREKFLSLPLGQSLCVCVISRSGEFSKTPAVVDSPVVEGLGFLEGLGYN
jgi:hypothetical protein